MRRAILLLSFLVCACGPSAGGNGGGGDDDSGVGGDDDEVDARTSRIDASDTTNPDPADAAESLYPDATQYDGGGTCNDWQCEDPNEDGCRPGAPDVCNDGTDNDCDTKVDEGCICAPGAVQDCFLGKPGQRGVGSCVDGLQTCVGTGEFTKWGECVGGIAPTPEACDGQDNDCNGCGDDNPSCCNTELACPGPGDMPEGKPFEDYIIDGTAFFSGTTTSWQWTVVGGPCDQLLGNRSFTLTGQTTSRLTFRPTLSGDYTVHVRIVASDGTVYECTFIVHIAGPGVRVEMCWDTTGQTDIDLHVHKNGSTTRWFTTGGIGGNNNDDCFYANCKAGAGATRANWGLPTSPLAECRGGPEGAQWQTVGSCANPRLDIDNISQAGIPENINIDNPVNNGTYRVMVHFYGINGLASTLPTHPLVNIYCGGTLLGTYGQAPDQLPGFERGEGYNAGQMWRVVDVKAQVTNGITTGCELTPLHPAGQTTGYNLTNDDNSY